MNLRAIRSILVTVVLSLASVAAPAADFVIYTQNLLHFGQGSAAKTKAKCDAIEAAGRTVDVILLQEVMQKQYPCASVPAGFVWESYGPLGSTIYKEFYGFLWRVTPRTDGPTITDGGYYAEAAASKFSRPPRAIFLKVAPHGRTTSYNVWIGNIHTIFGTKVSDRQKEATATATFFSSLKDEAAGDVSAPSGGFPVIIGGDWNLAAKSQSGKLNSGFEALVAAGAGIEPNVLTSLNSKAQRSSAYDHFSFSVEHVTLSNVEVHPAGSNEWKSWRQSVSDHLGVTAEVTFH